MVLVRLASEALVATTETLPIVENDTLVTFSAVGTADSEENTIAKSTLRNVDTSTGKSTMPLEVVSADLITVEFDALRFDAAASLQILQRHNTLIPRDSKLISSPYNDPDHLLDLRTLDTQNRLVAQALTFMKPVGGDYATADYGISFNWEEVLSNLQILVKAEGHQWTEQSFYTVIFRSQLNPDIDLQRLHDLDKTSHREATVSGGLLKYWFGKKDSWERNLATCIWRSKEDARLGGLGPDHKKARLAARELYKEIKFSTWKLVIEDGAKVLRIGEWEEKGGHGGRPHG